MNEQVVINEFQKAGALVSGHFVFSHGAHADTFLDAERLSRNPISTATICREMAALFVRDDVDVVVGPATGGIVLGHVVAYQLAKLTQRSVTSLYVHRRDDRLFSLRQGDESIVIGKRTLIVDDVATSWGSINETAQCIHTAGGEVVGAVVMWDRLGESSVDVNYRREALIRKVVPSWPARSCHLCKAGVPINTQYGHGATFIKQQGRS